MTARIVVAARTLLAAFVLVTAFGACSTLGVSAQAQEVPSVHRYRMSWRGITVLEAQYRVEDDGRRWRLIGEGATVGPARLLFPWRGTARSEGVEDGRTIIVRRHESEANVRGEARRTRLDWSDPEAAPVGEVQPSPDPREVTPVEPATLPGTVDPFTALRRMIDQVAAGGPCEGRERVWDGRRRYDVVVQPMGPRTIEPEEPGTYAGEAIGCRLIWERLGGFRVDETPVDANAERLVWLARLPDSGWAPVRIELTTRLGRVVGRLIVS